MAHPKGSVLGKKDFWMFMPFHVLYGCLYIIAFIPSMGAFCDAGRLIPHCFLMANIVFFLGYAWTCFLKHKNFYYSVEGKSMEENVLFAEQVSRLFKKYNVLVGMFIAQMIVAFSLQHSGNKFVECKHDGHVGAGWGVNSKVGILVFMSHVMPAMFCCAMPRYVFIKNVEGGFLDQLMEDANGKAKNDDDYDEVVEITYDRRSGSINTSFS